MSTLGKIAMVPGGALYGAGQAVASTYGGIYNRLAGQNPGRLRQGLAGLGSAIAGTVALPFAATAGAARGAFQGIANPIHSIGKRIGGAVSSVPGRVRGAVGNYGHDLTRDQNLLGTSGAEIASYGVTGTGTAATGARAGLDISSGVLLPPSATSSVRVRADRQSSTACRRTSRPGAPSGRLKRRLPRRGPGGAPLLVAMRYATSAKTHWKFGCATTVSRTSITLMPSTSTIPQRPSTSTRSKTTSRRSSSWSRRSA
jgi:hypothetical protein